MRLFIISNRLPVKVTRSSDGKFVFSRSEGGATGLKSLDVDCENIGSVGLASAWNKRRKKMTFAVNWKKIIIIRYSYPTGSMKITTKDTVTVLSGLYAITFMLIPYIRTVFGNPTSKSTVFSMRRFADWYVPATKYGYRIIS